MERPLLFRGILVRSLLRGNKTQTRRSASNSNVQRIKPGDVIWVREAFTVCDKGSILYKADHEEDKTLRWKPSIHIPKKYSRISLEILDIRTEKLLDISDSDAIAEGVEQTDKGWKNYLFNPDKPNTQTPDFLSPTYSFYSLWELINGKVENEDVIVLSFKIKEQPQIHNGDR